MTFGRSELFDSERTVMLQCVGSANAIVLVVAVVKYDLIFHFRSDSCHAMLWYCSTMILLHNIIGYVSTVYYHALLVNGHCVTDQTTYRKCHCVTSPV